MGIMVRSDDERYIPNPHELERRAAAPRLGTAPARLEPAGDRHRSRLRPKLRQRLDPPGPSRRRRRLAPSPSAWPHALALPRATGPDSRPVGTGSRGLRLARGLLD